VSARWSPPARWPTSATSPGSPTAIAAISQIRLDTPGRASYRRKLAAGKTTLEALRCLKRRISDALYRQLLADAQQAEPGHPSELVGTGPGGHCGATQESSAAGSHPHTGTSDQPLPGPANPTLRPAPTTRKTHHGDTLVTSP
jgi:hypothetical protein